LTIAKTYHNVLELIGNTPMLELRRMDAGPCRLLLKLELLNPAGSIKDRIGLSMIEAAERAGKLDPKGNPPPTVVEATAGNTGLALALVAGQRGYKLKVVVPDKMSQEKIAHLRAMGAEVVLTRSDVGKGHPEYYQDVAARIAKDTPNSFYTDQFSNWDNADAHYRTTGPEIFEQTEGKVDAVVLGVGSSGTLAGLAKFFRERKPEVKIILSDPKGSILAPLVNEGKRVEPGSWLVEGMGEDFIPAMCDLKAISEAIEVSDADAFFAARELLAKEGLLVGSSSGCLLHAALVWCRRQTRPLNVVTFACDSGAKYLSKMFNDFWMIDQGFIQRPRSGDLRDMIARRHDWREDYTLRATDPVKLAISRMQMYGVSQMAVMEDYLGKERVVGILDEGDVLLAVARNHAAFDQSVSDYMTRKLETLPPSAKVDDLIPLFRAGRVALIVDEHGAYTGLITQIDLINYLRRQLAR
jgi:cystathionine beta-synthase